MTIYIIMHGENSEGGTIDGVFTDRAKASAMLDEVTSRRSFIGCDWAYMVCYEGDGPQLTVGERIDRHG